MKTKTSFSWSCCLAMAFCAAACVVPAGCVGYKLGNTLPPGIKTVYVPMFINKTDEPMVETEVTRAVLQELQKDGSLEVVGEDYANSILEVSLVKITFKPLSFQQSERMTAKEYRLYLTADVLFKRAKTSEILSKRQVVGEATFFPAGDLASAKRLALPAVSKDLAHRIVEAVVEYW
jgi:hypothetical protein